MFSLPAYGADGHPSDVDRSSVYLTVVRMRGDLEHVISCTVNRRTRRNDEYTEAPCPEHEL